MKETKTPETETPSTDSDRASTGVLFLPKVVHLAIDVADKGQSTVIAVLQDARSELRTAIDGGLEYAEKLATGALRFSRKIVQRVDDTSREALASAERALANAVTKARETTRAAGETASGALRSQAS
jgi:hypothetical protein